jgi:hypothetical protein
MRVSLDRLPLDFDTSTYLEVKDPCPVYDGRQWHLFGTGVTGPHRFEILHATAPTLRGPWILTEPVDVSEVEGTCVAAPGAVVDAGRIHLFVQTDYNRLGGQIEHLVAADAAASRFVRQPPALSSAWHVGEAGIYDPHPAVIGGRRYLAYSAFTTVGEPDVHLARSATGTWSGPWRRLGTILEHDEVSCHNRRGDADYEWGLEGAQLVELPDGRVLLNAVCFTPGAPAGARQRVFFAVASDPAGPYDVLGPVLTPAGGDTTGENGHATAVVVDHHLMLFFQERDVADGTWRYGLAAVELSKLGRERREGAAA